MSWLPCEDPRCAEDDAMSPIEMAIVSKARDIGGFEVRRLLPSSRRRNGCRTRSGSFWTSLIAIPFGQAKPAESGCSGSGRTLVRRPSSTVATMPQSGSQIRQ